MCRYAIKGPYKTLFACFDCRKAFKQPGIEDWARLHGTGFALRELWAVYHHPKRLAEREVALGVTLSSIEADYQAATFKCPNCKMPMADLGRDCRVPRASNLRAWETLHRVYKLGHAFHTCGCNGPGFIPATAQEYRRYLEEKRIEYSSNADRAAQDPSRHSKKRSAEIGYWRERIAMIDRAMDRL